MLLIEPTLEYAKDIEAYRQEFLEIEGSMDGCGSLRRCATGAEWIEKCRLGKDPATVPEGLVPATQFIYVRESDDRVVGMLQLRHCFNEYLEKYAGHIGYSVLPSERRRTILRNGGVYESTVHEPERDRYLERYWIHLD